MNKLLKLVGKICLMFIFCLSMTTAASAAEFSGRTIVISKTEGSDVKMTKGTKQEFNAKEGYKLGEGYTVSTGNSSYCYLKLDDDTVVKMDQQSKVAVSKASKNKLSLSVQSGSIQVDAGIQAEGQVIETRVGNTGLTIRGTVFIIGRGEDGVVTITMLSGSGVVDGRELPEGATMLVYDDDDISKKAYELIDIDIEAVDLFTLLAIWEYQDSLVESGVITVEMLEGLPKKIDEKLKELDTPAPPQDVEQEIIYDKGVPAQTTAASSERRRSTAPKRVPASGPAAAAAASNLNVKDESGRILLTWDAFSDSDANKITYLWVKAVPLAPNGDDYRLLAPWLAVTTQSVYLDTLFDDYYGDPYYGSLLTSGAYKIVLVSAPNGNYLESSATAPQTLYVTIDSGGVSLSLLPQVAPVRNPTIDNSSGITLSWNEFIAADAQDIDHLTICAQMIDGDIYTLANNLSASATTVDLYALFNDYQNDPLNASALLASGTYKIIIISEPISGKSSNSVYLQDSLTVSVSPGLVSLWLQL